MVTRKTLCLKRLGGDRAGELRAGRFFDASDTATSAKTVVVNEALARHFWPGGDAVGSA